MAQGSGYFLVLLVTMKSVRPSVLVMGLLASVVLFMAFRWVQDQLLQLYYIQTFTVVSRACHDTLQSVEGGCLGHQHSTLKDQEGRPLGCVDQPPKPLTIFTLGSDGAPGGEGRAYDVRCWVVRAKGVQRCNCSW